MGILATIWREEKGAEEKGVEEKEIKEIIRKEREFYPMKSGAGSQSGK